MRYTITLPVLDNDKRPFPSSDREDFEGRFLRIFGGCTVHYARGIWPNPNTGIVYRDDVEVFEAYSHDTFGTEYQLIALARLACRIFRQEAIFVTIGGRHELVTIDSPDTNID